MNPKTKETAERLNLIRILSANPEGLTMDELKHASGLDSELDLKKALGKLYMVGTYPYSPMDYLEIEYNGTKVRLLQSQNLHKTIALSPREWILLRDALESEMNSISNSDPNYKTISEILSRIKKFLPFNTMVSFSSTKKILREAITNHKVIQFNYRSREDSKLSPQDSDISEPRKVNPWYLLESNTDYLIGYCHSRKSSRIFRLESMIDLSIISETFVPPTSQITQQAIESFEKFLDESSIHGTTAIFWHTRESYYALNNIFQLTTSSQSKSFEGTEMIQSSCRVPDSRWFVESLLPFLPDVILVQPTELKEELIQFIQTAYSIPINSIQSISS